MLSAQIANSLRVLLQGVEQDVAAEYSVSVGKLVVDAVGRGALHSSGFTLSADQLAADAMRSAGERVLSEAVSAHVAEPTTGPVGRAAHLSELVGTALTGIGERLRRGRDERLRSIQGMPRGDALERAIVMVSARTLARLSVQLTASNNAQSGRTTTIHVSGQVASLQTGDHSTAVVTQAIRTARAEDAAQALEQIAAALRQMTDTSAAGAMEMVTDLKEQAAREEPNALKVSSLIGGLGTVIQTIPALRPAWETVLSWAAFVREAARAIGP